MGQSFSITDTTRNIGGGPAGPSTVAYFLSPVPERVREAVRLAPRRQRQAIEAGQTESSTTTVRVPALPQGSYFLLACADIFTHVAEIDEHNNCTATAGTGEIRPDLFVRELSDPPESIGLGDSFNLTATTANLGSVGAPATVTRFFLSEDREAGSDDLPLQAVHAVPELPPGQSSTATIRLTPDRATPVGVYMVLACADAEQVAVELYEENNCQAARTPIAIEPSRCGENSGGVVVDQVATSDGFTQLRQGSSAELVITGSGLDQVTEVQLDDLVATVISRAPAELRAAISIAHGAAPAQMTIRVRRAPAPACSMPLAIELTPIVVSPSGTDDGRGTFQSPLRLCARELRDIAGSGDTVLLLAGEHNCSEAEFAGVTVTGQGFQTHVNGSIRLRGTVLSPCRALASATVAPGSWPGTRPARTLSYSASPGASSWAVPRASASRTEPSTPFGCRSTGATSADISRAPRIGPSLPTWRSARPGCPTTRSA